MVQVAQNLRRSGVLLRPLPVALPVGIEAVHVVDAGYVDASTRIPVPVPRAAEVIGCFEDAQSVAGAAEAVGKIKPCNTCAYHYDVEIGRRAVCAGYICHQPIITPRRPPVLRNGY